MRACVSVCVSMWQVGVVAETDTYTPASTSHRLASPNRPCFFLLMTAPRKQIHQILFFLSPFFDRLFLNTFGRVLAPVSRGRLFIFSQTDAPCWSQSTTLGFVEALAGVSWSSVVIRFCSWKQIKCLATVRRPGGDTKKKNVRKLRVE